MDTIKLEIVPFAVAGKDAWDRVVKESKNGNFLHLRDYMDYHSGRFDEQSVIIFKQGKAIAAFPCNRVGDQIVSHGGLTYGGLLYGNSINAVEVLDIFCNLISYFRKFDIKSILYKSIPHVFHKYPAEEDLYALFRLRAQHFRRDISSVVQLDNRIKFSDLRKRTIRKAVKLGVEIREGDFIEDYYTLLSQVVAKFGAAPVHSAQELQLLKSRFPDNIRMFGAFNGEQLLAGTIIYDFGHIVHAQYLANSDEGKDMGALDSILGHLIENTFSTRRYFSLGISTEQDGHYLNEGLIFQKEGFGARGVIHDFYKLDITKKELIPNSLR
jgi:hypothetical protein